MTFIINIIYWILLIGSWIWIIKYRRIVKSWTWNFVWAERYLWSWWTYLILILVWLWLIFFWALVPFWWLDLIVKPWELNPNI